MTIEKDAVSLLLILHLITGLCSFVLAGFVFAASARPQVKVSLAPTIQHHNLNSTLVAVFMLGIGMDMLAVTFSVSYTGHLAAMILASISGVTAVALFTAQMVRQWI